MRIQTLNTHGIQGVGGVAESGEGSVWDLAMNRQLCVRLPP